MKTADKELQSCLSEASGLLNL